MHSFTLALTHITAPIVIFMALVSYFRREEAIGGWLLLFFSQMYTGVTVVLLASIPVVAHAFPAPPAVAKPTAKLVLVVFMIRLAAYAGVAIASTFLLRERNSLSVQRLRLALGAAVLLSGVTLTLDAIYFPTTLFRNFFGGLALLAWFIYFFVSARVEMVFVSKTWGEIPA